MQSIFGESSKADPSAAANYWCLLIWIHFARQRQTRCYVCKCVENGWGSLAWGGPEKMHCNCLLLKSVTLTSTTETCCDIWYLSIDVRHFMLGKVLSLLCTNPYDESGLPKFQNSHLSDLSCKPPDLSVSMSARNMIASIFMLSANKGDLKLPAAV